MTRFDHISFADDQIFGKKFGVIADDDNALLQALRTGEVISFKKAQVCKVIKEIMGIRLTRKHTHMRVHTYTHVHTRTHTQYLSLSHTHTHTHTHTRAHMYTQTYTAEL